MDLKYSTNWLDSCLVYRDRVQEARLISFGSSSFNETFNLEHTYTYHVNSLASNHFYFHNLILINS